VTFAKTHPTAAFILVVLWFTVIPHARADSILLNQVAGPASGFGGIASLHSLNINILSADNFKLDTGAFITGMQWQGSYDSLPPDNFINQFVVTFWSDTNGLPGSALQTYTFNGKAGETFVATDQFDFVLNNYAVIFPTPFTVHNGVTYWLSIQAISGRQCMALAREHPLRWTRR